MTILSRFFLGLLIGLFLGAATALSVNALAANEAYPYVTQDESLVKAGAATAGYKLGTSAAGVAFNAGVWSGWIYSERQAAVCLDITFIRSAATGVTMRCESSQLSTTTADSGHDLHMIDAGAGTANSYPITWTYTSSASKNWVWCIDDPPGRFLNCLFDDLASGGANDLLTVVARGVSP